MSKRRGCANSKAKVKVGSLYGRCHRGKSGKRIYCCVTKKSRAKRAARPSFPRGMTRSMTARGPNYIPGFTATQKAAQKAPRAFTPGFTATVKAPKARFIKPSKGRYTMKAPRAKYVPGFQVSKTRMKTMR